MKLVHIPRMRLGHEFRYFWMNKSILQTPTPLGVWFGETRISFTILSLLLLLSCAKKEPEFIRRYNFGVTPCSAIYPSPGDEMGEYILVQNAPGDTTVAEMIIDYAAAHLKGLEEIKAIDRLYTYGGYFYKYSGRLEERFDRLWQNRSDPYYYLNHKRELPTIKRSDYLGSFNIIRYDNKYVVYLSVETGITGDYEDPDETQQLYYTLFTEEDKIPDNFPKVEQFVNRYFEQINKQKRKAK